MNRQQQQQMQQSQQQQQQQVVQQTSYQTQQQTQQVVQQQRVSRVEQHVTRQVTSQQQGDAPEWTSASHSRCGGQGLVGTSQCLGRDAPVTVWIEGQGVPGVAPVRTRVPMRVCVCLCVRACAWSREPVLARGRRRALVHWRPSLAPLPAVLPAALPPCPRPVPFKPSVMAGSPAWPSLAPSRTVRAGRPGRRAPG